MIKAIIIDDDVEMLQGLSHFIPWDEYGFTVCGFSKNGTEGLALAKTTMPNVIITDITMPSMNGLELIQEAKKILPKVKSIILSCHEDFHYAKEAIRLGADEYMLKHTLTKEDFIEALIRIKDSIMKEQTIIEELSNTRISLNKNKGIIQEKFFLDILDGIIPISNAIETAKKLKLPLPSDKFYAVALYFDNMDKTISDTPIKEKGLFKFSVLNIIDDTLPNTDTLNFFAYNNIFILLFWGTENESAHSLQLQSLLKKLQNNIKTFLKINVSICISSTYNNLTELNQAICEMNNLRDSYFYSTNGAIVIAKDYIFNNDTKTAFSINPENLYLKYGIDFQNIINTQNPAYIKEYMNNLFSELIINKYSPISIHQLFDRLLLDIEVLLNKYQLSLKPDKINNDTFDACKNQLDNYINQGINILLKQNHRSSRTEIQQVLNYIDLHLNTSISCETMAEMVNLNFSYFSRLFKSEVGVSFSDYLLNKRINVATNLLTNSNYSVEKIVEIIGITSTSYFYRAYKKITGKTPGDVRGE